MARQHDSIINVGSRANLVQNIAARFSQDPGCCTVDDLRHLLLCGEFASAFALYKVLTESHGVTAPSDVDARLNIGLGRAVPALPKETKKPRWVAHFAATGVDLAYPANLVSLSVDPGAKRCCLIDHCPACGQQRPLDPSSDFIREFRYFCPNCLALRTIDRPMVRAAVSKIYLEYFNALPCNDEGLFTEDSITKALSVAMLLRPLLLIRFGYMYSGRIGHQALNTGIYLNIRKKYFEGNDALDIVGDDETVANEQLSAMFRRVLEAFSRKGTQVAKRLPSDSPHFVYELHTPNPYDRRSSSRDIGGLFQDNEAMLRFTDEEQARGLRELENMGVSKGAPFVCLHARDNAYLQKLFPDRNTSYHDYRDADIDTYAKAALALAKRGVFVIRMGSVVNKPFAVDSPLVIDYANTCRSDFMDIWLSANCLFFLGTGSGPDGVASLFKRPVLFTNLLPITFVSSWVRDDLTLPKRLYATKLGRFLSLSEIVRSGVGEFMRTEEYREADIRVVDNTAEEIEAATLEMLAFVRGEWEDSPEDAARQKRFWRLLAGNSLHGPLRSKICATFLRDYPLGL